MATVYKIRRRTDGKYSMGGSHPSFNTLGKIWKRRGDLTNHLNLVWRKGQVYADCDVLELELVERVHDTLPVSHYLAQVEARKLEQERDLQTRREARAKAERRRQYEELAKEFGGQLPMPPARKPL